MLIVLLVVQTIVSFAMIGVILLQHQASDGLSGLGGGGSQSLLSSRGSANILTRTTSIFAVIFMVNCLAMATIAARKANITYKFTPNTTSVIPPKPSTPLPSPSDTTSPENKSPAAAPLAE